MRKSLKDIKHIVFKKPYDDIIPKELESYHYYIIDSGHSIMCILECHLKEAKEKGMDDYEVPIPVKYVLENGWKVEGDYIIVDAPYELPYGVMIEEKYYEY
jgi:hypothetical protein